MNNEILAKARAAKSPEELKSIMSSNGIEDFSDAAAQKYFDYLNMSSGEISDEELDVSAGGCKVNGHTVVTCNRKYHCGRWASGKNGYYLLRNDHCDIRNMWSFMSSGNGPGTDKCGACLHLGFSGGIGYCEID